MYLRYKDLDPVKISLKNLHYQDLSISYAQSDSEKYYVDSRAWPTGPQRADSTTVRGCNQIGGEEP